jgi:hypothetical protein
VQKKGLQAQSTAPETPRSAAANTEPRARMGRIRAASQRKNGEVKPEEIIPMDEGEFKDF